MSARNHIKELTDALTQNPEEAHRIARFALLGLWVCDENGTVLRDGEDFPSGADYIDHVTQGIQGCDNVQRLLTELQTDDTPRPQCPNCHQDLGTNPSKSPMRESCRACGQDWPNGPLAPLRDAPTEEDHTQE